MNWSNGNTAGFVSAAIVRADSDLAAVHDGLSLRLRALLRASVPEASERRAHLPALVRHFGRPFPTPESLPPRARPLVAASYPRDVARAWLEGVPRARPGYRAHADFVLWLRRSVSRAASSVGESR